MSQCEYACGYLFVFHFLKAFYKLKVDILNSCCRQPSSDLSCASLYPLALVLTQPAPLAKKCDQGWGIGIVKVAGKAVCVKVRVPRQASRQVRISEREGRAHHEGWRRLGRA